MKSGLYNIFVPFTHITDVGFFTAVLAVVAGLQWYTLEKTDDTLKTAQRPWISVNAATGTDGLSYRS